MQKGAQGKYLADRQQAGEVHSQGVPRRRRLHPVCACQQDDGARRRQYLISINIPIAHATAGFHMITDVHTHTHIHARTHTF
jgi:hypothetical protein